MMQHRPTNLQLVQPNHLKISWNDSVIHQLPVKQLRDACPCATCREKRDSPAPDANLLPVLSIEETRPLSILDMRPVGNYAYGIHFSDGHDTGIFTLQFLRELGEATADHQAG